MSRPKPGDFDPFPNERINDCPASAGGYVCTRDASHDEPHVAEGGRGEVYAVWPPYEDLFPDADVDALADAAEDGA